MEPEPKPTRLLDVPWIHSLQGGRLISLREEKVGKQSNLILFYQAFQATAPPIILLHDKRPEETVQGIFVLRCLRFSNVRRYKPDAKLPDLSEEQAAGKGHLIGTVMHWHAPDENLPFVYILTEMGGLLFWAEDWAFVDVEEVVETAVFTRPWSPAPPMPARAFDEITESTKQFGGNPIAFRLGQQEIANHLFVGGVHFQGEKRPLVDIVLNLGEQPSRWLSLPVDRWAEKGEGTAGMTVAEIVDQARWIIEQLQANKSLLIHCVAGFNRSVTVCCATLILLEQISAEAALNRVWQQHPWGRPDAHHWLALRWIAQENSIGSPNN